MQLLVDGMNVIGSRPDGWWKDRRGAMRKLVERLDSYAATSGDSVAVFLDSKPFELPGGTGEGVEVVFAFPGRDAADDAIVEAVQDRADRPARDDIRVVTSDRGLIGRLEALDVSVIPASAFRRRVDEEPDL
jgi:predicted RNA-binding protein with PIN domain